MKKALNQGRSVQSSTGLTLALTMLGIQGAACADDVGAPQRGTDLGVASQSVDNTPPPEFYIKGKRFVLRRTNVPVESERLEYPPAKVPVVTSLPTEAELAEALRPVMLNANTRAEYIMDGKNTEAARRTLRRMSQEVVGDPGRRGIGSVEEAEGDTLKAGECCGADTRTKIRSNTAYWYSTLIALAHPVAGTPLGQTTNANWKPLLSTGGSAALIGRSTALSCAHAFYEAGVGWLPTKIWGTAVDAEDGSPPGSAGPIASGYPQAYGHYSVWIPYYWTLLDENGNPRFSLDLAVLDFNEPGFVHRWPGDAAGWLGWGVYNDATIEGRGIRNYGFPGGGGPVPIQYYPQIWGQYMSGGIDATDWEIRSSLDSSGGTSGRPAVQYIDGGYRVVGTLSGVFPYADGTVYTRDRRFDSGYEGFMRSVSDDY